MLPRLAAVEELMSMQAILQDITSQLKGIPDVERLLAR